MKTNNAFTLKHLIVTICVVLFLLFIISIIMPAIPGCGGNLSDCLKCSVQLRGIGIAISLYQNDYNDMNPVVWSDKAEKSQFGMGLYNKPGEMKYTRWADKDFSNWDKEQTIGGCLYLLAKYINLVPKMFLCPSDDSIEVMDLQDAIDTATLNGYPAVEGWEDLNDFYSMANLIPQRHIIYIEPVRLL